MFSEKKQQRGRSLSWVDSTGAMYQYYMRPLSQACLFILVQEACERLAYYGIAPNLQKFLSSTLKISANDANMFITIFQALVYFFPLISAILADTWLGSFATILIFSGLYMVGLALLCISAIPSISQNWMVYVSLLFFIALGAGGIKSCVNVMGASQFHPTEHQKDITRFFTFFYAAINVGAIVGGIVVPLVQQVTDSYFISYLIPLGSFAIATFVFAVGSPRYVKMKPQGSQILQILRVIGTSAASCSPVDMRKESRGGRFKDQFIEDTKSLGYLLPIFLLTVPFNMCYVCLTTHQLYFELEPNANGILHTESEASFNNFWS
jgi:peptide/histidine transporter 3/4